MNPVQAAEHFYRAGGTVPWSEWTRLCPEQQQAMVIARERVMAEDLFRLAQALSGPEGLADVISIIDGGRTLTRFKLQEAVDRASRG